MHGISLGFQILALFLIPPVYLLANPLFNVQPTSDQQLFTTDGPTMINTEKPPVTKGTYSDPSKSQVNAITSEKNGYVNAGANLSDGFMGIRNEREEQTSM